MNINFRNPKVWGAIVVAAIVVSAGLYFKEISSPRVTSVPKTVINFDSLVIYGEVFSPEAEKIISGEELTNLLFQKFKESMVSKNSFLDPDLNIEVRKGGGMEKDGLYDFQIKFLVSSIKREKSNKNLQLEGEFYYLVPYKRKRKTEKNRITIWSGRTDLGVQSEAEAKSKVLDIVSQSAGTFVNQMHIGRPKDPQRKSSITFYNRLIED